MLTVLMATHNGAKTLPRVLDAYIGLKPPHGGWRLVVVDNASTDDTPRILKDYTAKLPLLSLRTEKRGKNIALNLGLEHISGDLVVFTDDDAIPAENWLIALAQVSVEQPDFDIFGGGIEPIWPDLPPDWIPRLVNLGATYAITPTGLSSGPVSAHQIWGPNMAVRQKVFASGHRFNEDIGPQAGQYAMGSEVEFTCRMERLGHKAWFTTECSVGHIIEANQLERAWIIKRAHRLGRHMYHQDRDGFTDLGRLLWLSLIWKHIRLVGEYAKRFYGGLNNDFDRQFRADWEISFLKAYIAESAKQLLAGGTEPRPI